ncbi:uncharacterized protein L969DRAFT_104841 [Mixia osmundae IAM 14324]|uniref:Cytochrome c oxidase assembly factor 5 n=1 Tax=Mixia osmundae (strain CBS 9802 / IAM 14324 / JCM 22182 / KY 12970) TaxID=764103 RepID=G7DS20_MIXOS|nr:uncharacterized protein L969DRAFT_104841 [Mixia osmundae IAM 14324]KEI37566.1 hypothetical protein L969DRAFT_104841 [Mixia osmundae IAM 14324]GAA93380.1 hypothetical protein E5Q_00020 [Mixia osmundae IAM 14324]
MACRNLKADLVLCVQRSPCCVRDHNDVATCLRDHTNELPEECRHLRTAFFECKRGMLDMRKRFRGLDTGTRRQDLSKAQEIDKFQDPLSAAAASAASGPPTNS